MNHDFLFGCLAGCGLGSILTAVISLFSAARSSKRALRQSKEHQARAIAQFLGAKYVPGDEAANRTRLAGMLSAFPESQPRRPLFLQKPDYFRN